MSWYETVGSEYGESDPYTGEQRLNILAPGNIEPALQNAKPSLAFGFDKTTLGIIAAIFGAWFLFSAMKG